MIENFLITYVGEKWATDLLCLFLLSLANFISLIIFTNIFFKTTKKSKY